MSIYCLVKGKKLILISSHALKRMDARGLNRKKFQMVFRYGRRVRIIYVIGKREVKKYQMKEGVWLAHLEGIQVLCSPNETTVVTVYRNRDFKSLKESFRFS